jgi:hypothetical protein
MPEAGRELTELIEKTCRGEEILIIKDSSPVATLPTIPVQLSDGERPRGRNQSHGAASSAIAEFADWEPQKHSARVAAAAPILKLAGEFRPYSPVRESIAESA